MAQEHRVKTLVPYWDAIERGDKTFDVRRDDRGYQRGDILVLEKYDAKDGYITFVPPGSTNSWDYEKQTLRRVITYVLTGGQFGIAPGYVVLGLKPVPEPTIAGTIDADIPSQEALA